MSTKILIIDDDENMRSSLEDILSLDGYDTIFASTGKEGLEKVTQDKPDLVILDLQLPDMPGLEICRRIRTDDTVKQTPILMFSGHFIQTDDKVQGLGLGADDYLLKPVNPREMLARIKILLRRTHPG